MLNSDRADRLSRDRRPPAAAVAGGGAVSIPARSRARRRGSRGSGSERGGAVAHPRARGGARCA